MHKLLNFICLPFFIAGLIFLSNGLLGYNSYEIYIESNTKTSSQINNLYSEKEITLKGPPVSEVLSDKIFVKIRNKPINPILISNIKIKNNTFENTYLSDTDFDYLNSNKKEFVKTVLPLSLIHI